MAARELRRFASAERGRRRPGMDVYAEENNFGVHDSDDGLYIFSGARSLLGMRLRMRNIRGRNRVTVSTGVRRPGVVPDRVHGPVHQLPRDSTGFRILQQRQVPSDGFHGIRRTVHVQSKLGSDARSAVLVSATTRVPIVATTTTGTGSRTTPLATSESRECTQACRRTCRPAFWRGSRYRAAIWTYPNYDRDTQIGTGSTDLLLGAYKIGMLPMHLGSMPLMFENRPFQYYVQVNYDLPLWGQDSYTPGREVDGAVGTIYDFGHVWRLTEARTDPFFSSLLIARAIRATTRLPLTVATPALSLLQEVRSRSGVSDFTRTSRFRSFKTCGAIN